MSIRPAQANERLANASFNATADKDSIAGNAFAALFGQAYAQQAQQAQQANPLPAVAASANAAKPGEIVAPKSALNVRTPAKDGNKPNAETQSDAGVDTSVEGTPKTQSANTSQKKTAASTEKKDETGNADAAASAMALNQQQTAASKVKASDASPSTASGNVTDVLQGLQGKRMKKTADAKEAKELTPAIEPKTSATANTEAVTATGMAEAQNAQTALTAARAKPQDKEAIADALSGKSAPAMMAKAQLPDSAVAATPAMQNAVTKTDLTAGGAATQDLSEPMAATDLLNANADLANGSKKTEATGLQTTGLPDFNRLLATQTPAAQTSTTSSSQALNQALSQTQSNQPAENLTGKALPSVADNRAVSVGNQKETIAQAGLRDDVSSGKTAASSLSVSDAGVAARAISATKPESAAVESQPGTRNTPAADRPRLATVNLQQAASVQSSSNSSNVTTMAVEGLESKLAVPQNTGLQAAGLSVFQSMQRQDEPLKMEIATPITQPGFTEELKETVKLVSTRDLREVEVTINPEELGPIKLKVQMTGDKAEVTFQAENEQTRTLLADAVPALTESLAESGIDLRNALVEKPQQSLENNTGNLFQGQSQREQRNPDANFQQGQGRNGRQDNTGFEADKKAATAEVPKRRNNGLLDTYA